MAKVQGSSTAWTAACVFSGEKRFWCAWTSPVRRDGSGFYFGVNHAFQRGFAVTLRLGA
jgi:hypothetical protein